MEILLRTRLRSLLTLKFCIDQTFSTGHLPHFSIKANFINYCSCVEGNCLKLTDYVIFLILHSSLVHDLRWLEFTRECGVEGKELSFQFYVRVKIIDKMLCYESPSSREILSGIIHQANDTEPDPIRQAWHLLGGMIQEFWWIIQIDKDTQFDCWNSMIKLIILSFNLKIALILEKQKTIVYHGRKGMLNTY